MDQSNAAVAFVLGWPTRKPAIIARPSAQAAAATIDPKLVPAHLALADGYLRIQSRPSQRRHCGQAGGVTRLVGTTVKARAVNGSSNGS
jgi:hypothetical protein